MHYSLWRDELINIVSLSLYVITIIILLCYHVHPCRGEEAVLRKRIKQHMRKQLIQSNPSPPWELVNQVESNPYGLDYLCVLDFEATCEEINPPDYIHEIIEFPVLLLNLKTLEIVRKCP